MTQLAQQHGAINLAQGFPNFEPDARLLEIAAKVVKTPVHQYMPSSGFVPLIDKIADLLQTHYNRSVSQGEILITAGATQAIYTAVQALVTSGDEVIILDPAYDCYDTPVNLVGARAIHIPLGAGFLPDWNAIRRSMTEKTRLIIINNPHNPSGTVWQNADFEALESLCADYPNLAVLSDEVYEFIAFEPHHQSIHQREKLVERSVVISSFGKSLHITGWKVGYLVAPEDLIQPIKNVHQFMVFSVNSVAQAALAEYLDVVDFKELKTFYRAKRDKFRQLLHDTRFTALPCQGTYFQVASYADISSSPDVDFARWLVSTKGVAAIPLSVFNQSGRDDKLIRFCFAKDDQTLEKAGHLLKF